MKEYIVELNFEPDYQVCTTCRHGCTCRGNVDPGCEHWSCWGINPTGTCPDVPKMRAALNDFMMRRYGTHVSG
jgi:hypothetical protein